LGGGTEGRSSCEVKVRKGAVKDRRSKRKEELQCLRQKRKVQGERQKREKQARTGATRGRRSCNAEKSRPMHFPGRKDSLPPVKEHGMAFDWFEPSPELRAITSRRDRSTHMIHT